MQADYPRPSAAYDAFTYNATENPMTYDIQQAQAHFAAKQSFTTGPHELTGMIDRKEDIVIVDAVSYTHLTLPTNREV